MPQPECFTCLKLSSVFKFSWFRWWRFHMACPFRGVRDHSQEKYQFTKKYSLLLDEKDNPQKRAGPLAKECKMTFLLCLLLLIFPRFPPSFSSCICMNEEESFFVLVCLIFPRFPRAFSCIWMKREVSLSPWWKISPRSLGYLDTTTLNSSYLSASTSTRHSQILCHIVTRAACSPGLNTILISVWNVINQAFISLYNILVFRVP